MPRHLLSASASDSDPRATRGHSWTQDRRVSFIPLLAKPGLPFISNDNTSPSFSVQVTAFFLIFVGLLSKIQICLTLALCLVFIGLPMGFCVYWSFSWAGPGPRAADLPEVDAKCQLPVSSHLPKYHLRPLRPLIPASRPPPQPLSCSPSPQSFPADFSPIRGPPRATLRFLGH